MEISGPTLFRVHRLSGFLTNTKWHFLQRNPLEPRDSECYSDMKWFNTLLPPSRQCFVGRTFGNCDFMLEWNREVITLYHAAIVEVGGKSGIRRHST